MNTYKKRILGVGFGKATLFFLFFGFFMGIILGVLVFILIKASILALDLKEIPTVGLIFLSFLLVPLLSAIIFAIFGFILFIFVNLSLYIIRGIDVKLREEDTSY